MSTGAVRLEAGLTLTPSHDPLAQADSERADVALAQACDAQAFERLYRSHVARIHSLVRRMVGGEADADELVQDVFVRVHHALQTFRGDAQFGSWVYRIAFNQALNVKARMRYRAPHLPADVLSAAASPEGSPYQQLHESRQAQALDDCVAELPEVYQSALRLYYWMGADVDEIARLLAVPANTVKSYLHRARRLLRGLLQERGHDEL